MLDISLRQLELARLDLGLHILQEMQVSALGFFIIGVARHRDIAAGRFLIERGGQLAPLEQPTLELAH